MLFLVVSFCKVLEDLKPITAIFLALKKAVDMLDHKI